MAKTNFSGPITTGRFQSNGATQVRTSQFLQNSAQFPIDYAYFEATTDADRLATVANNPAGNQTVDLESVAGTNVSGLTFGGGIPAMVVTLTSSGNDSSNTFTITGTDVNGFAQTEDLTGPSSTTTSSAKGYKTITDVVSDNVFVGNISMGILMTDKISWALRSLYNIVPGSAAGGAAQTSTTTNKNLANNIVIPQQSRLIELKLFNWTAFDTAGFDVEFGANLSQAGGATLNSFDDNYFTTTTDVKAVGLFSVENAGLTQGVALAPRMFNVSNGDTAGYPMEKILVMSAKSDDTMSTGYGVVTATWLQLNNATN